MQLNWIAVDPNVKATKIITETMLECYNNT